jgi:hypothetical protein
MTAETLTFTVTLTGGDLVEAEPVLRDAVISAAHKLGGAQAVCRSRDGDPALSALDRIRIILDLPPLADGLSWREREDTIAAVREAARKADIFERLDGRASLLWAALSQPGREAERAAVVLEVAKQTTRALAERAADVPDQVRESCYACSALSAADATRRCGEHEVRS